MQICTRVDFVLLWTLPVLLVIDNVFWGLLVRVKLTWGLTLLKIHNIYRLLRITLTFIIQENRDLNSHPGTLRFTLHINVVILHQQVVGYSISFFCVLVTYQTAEVCTLPW